MVLLEGIVIERPLRIFAVGRAGYEKCTSVNWADPVMGVGRSFMLPGGEVFGFLSINSNIESAAIFALLIFGAKVLKKKKRNVLVSIFFLKKKKTKLIPKLTKNSCG